MILIQSLLGIMGLNSLIFLWYTRYRVLGQYTNPYQEWDNRPIKADFWGIFVMPLLDMWHCRKKETITIGSFDNSKTYSVYTIYYNSKRDRFTLAHSGYSQAYSNMDYESAIGIVNFWYADNATIRHKYLRVIRLLKRNDPKDFINNVLKRDIINSSLPIDGTIQVDYDSETQPVL